MEAPQIVLIALWTLTLGVTLARHGEGGKYNIFVSSFRTGILVSILYWGGFFSGQ